MLSCLEASREGRGRFLGGERRGERGGKSEDAAVPGEGEGGREGQKRAEGPRGVARVNTVEAVKPV